MFMLERRLRDVLDSIQEAHTFDSKGRLTCTDLRSSSTGDRRLASKVEFHTVAMTDILWGYTVLFHVVANSLIDLVLDVTELDGNVADLDERCTLCAPGGDRTFRASEAILAILLEKGPMRRIEMIQVLHSNDIGAEGTTDNALRVLQKSGLLYRPEKSWNYDLTPKGEEMAMEAVFAGHSFRDCNESWWFNDVEPDPDTYSLHDAASYFLCDIQALRNVALEALNVRAALTRLRPVAA